MNRIAEHSHGSEVLPIEGFLLFASKISNISENLIQIFCRLVDWQALLSKLRAFLWAASVIVKFLYIK